jgi:DNA repair protein RecO (recombination protein O)
LGTDPLGRAYVLHARRYGDTSLLLELFGEHAGRVACVARGAAAGKRRAAHLQPFRPLLVDLRGRGEVQSLAGVEPDGPPLMLSGRKAYCGLYVNELLWRLTARGDPAPALFNEYAQTLAALVTVEAVDPVLRRFEVGLLRQLGHALVLDTDCDGRPIDPTRDYEYVVDAGPQPATGSGAGRFPGRLFDALRTGEFADAEILRAARVFMREVLDHHLDGKPIRSRDLFR